jgi:MSHA biogenesis protein MshN
MQSAAVVPAPAIQKTITAAAPKEEAEARYRKAAAWLAKGQERLARPLLEEALELAPGHARARQLLATLLNGAGQNREAEAVLRGGLMASPEHPWFPLGLARLEAARGEEVAAVETLVRGLERAIPDAEYHATLAALQLRLKRPADAAVQYLLALKLQSDQGSWWLGLALALEAQGKTDEAYTAYQRALVAGNLPQKLADFVQGRLARETR